MPDYLLLMRNDAPEPAAAADWGAYLARLRAGGHLQGGSAIGPGLCLRKAGPVPPPSDHLSGFIRLSADSLDQARALVAGNPVFQAGGTVEIRELPVSD